MKLYNPKKQLWLLAMLSMIGTIGISLPYPIFAPMLLGINHNSMVPAFWSSNSQPLILGVILAMYPLGVFIGSPILGGLSDIYGRSKLIIYSLFFTTFGYILTGLAIQINSIYLLLFTRFLTGFMESNIAIIRSSVADMPNINKHRSFGLISTGVTLGYVIGPPLGGVFSNSNLVSWFNYATPFYLAGTVSLLASIISWLNLSETYISNRGHKTLNYKLLLSEFNILSKLNHLCINKDIKLLFIMSFFVYLAVDIYYEFYPAYLFKANNMGAFDIALLTAILSLGMAISGLFLTGYYARQHRIKRTLFIHILLYMLMLVLTIYIAKLIILCLVFSLTGVCILVTSNQLMVQTSDTAGSANQGKVLGMATGLRMLGDAAVSVFGGFLIIISPAWPLFAAIFMAVIPLWLIIVYLK